MSTASREPELKKELDWKEVFPPHNQICFEHTFYPLL